MSLRHADRARRAEEYCMQAPRNCELAATANILSIISTAAAPISGGTTRDPLHRLRQCAPRAEVWGYALVWFLINDGVKLLGYRILDPKGAPVLSQRSATMAPAGA